MPISSLQMTRPSIRTPAPKRTSPASVASHLRIWLAARALDYGDAIREPFATAHPALFGRRYWVTLQGYDQWLVRHGLSDSLDTFARYLAPRYDRWLASQGAARQLAPCLIGRGSHTKPCWMDGD